MRKTFTLIAVFLLAIAGVRAQEQSGVDKVMDKLDFGVHIKSIQLFRGLTPSEVPMIGADLSYALDKQGNLKVGIFGGMGVTDNSNGYQYREVNWYLNYAANGFYIGFWDVLTPELLNNYVAGGDIWNYTQDETGHRLEVRAGYEFKGYPVKIDVAQNLMGDRSVLDNNEERYTMYVELSAPIIRHQKVDLGLFVGMAAGLGGNGIMYGGRNADDNFNFVNVGLTATKNLKITNSYTLPLSFTAAWNPADKGTRVQLAANIF